MWQRWVIQPKGVARAVPAWYLKRDAPPDDDCEQWRRRLYNLELAMAAFGQATGTVVGMRSGFRYARNQTLVNVMRDYDYVDARGMGCGTRKSRDVGAQRHGARPDRG